MNKLSPLLVRIGTALLLLFFLSAFLLPRAAAADQVAVSFSPDADTLVKQLFPGNNYGSSVQLRTDGFPIVHSYLRFTVHGLGGLAVLKAQLQLYANSNSRVGIGAVAVADNSWGETTMTYNNAPALGQALSSSSPFSSGNWVPLDVSSYVTGEGTYSIAITTPGITAISLASRESGPNNAPRLVLLLGSADTPTASPTPPAGDTPTPSPVPAVSDTPTSLPPPAASETPTASPTLSITDTPAPSATSVSTDTPIASPTATSTATVPPSPAGSIKHVFVVVMENKGYDEVWNTGSSPYVTSLGNTYARAANYHAITHPSLPNYLDLVGGSSFGITSDCLPSSTCTASGQNLGDALDARGLTWKGYMESMPAPCYLTGSGNYAPKHNPFVYFDDIRLDATRCASHDVPYTALSGDLASAATTPNFALISPNLCNDMHDCSVSTGDTWLQNNVSQMLSAPACTAEQCLVVVVWDEDDGSAGNHILAIFAGPGAKTGGVTSAVAYNHFSLLRTVEYIFGLPALTGSDGGASPMTDMLR